MYAFGLLLFALAVKLAIILLFLIRECDSFEVQEAGATVRVDLREAKKRKNKNCSRLEEGKEETSKDDVISKNNSLDDAKQRDAHRLGWTCCTPPARF
jgi:hypothetical protein